MIKNVFVNGRLQSLFVAEESSEEGGGLFDILQAQAERIELLEEQNSALIRQEKILLQLLELSTKTGRVITDSFLELKELMEQREKSGEISEELLESFLHSESSAVSRKNTKKN